MNVEAWTWASLVVKGRDRVEARRARGRIQTEDDAHRHRYHARHDHRRDRDDRGPAGQVGDELRERNADDRTGEAAGNGDERGLDEELANLAAELVDLSAYLMRLVALIGQDLGLGEFRELRWQRESSHIALCADAADSFIALEAANATDMGALRRSAGL